ncbi:MAG: rhomboid family intramembrane serine protease [Bacteroidetes bacterium]|nr:rhomboid family intramembrane serine protease [Bacteroidota bacterium]
MSITILIVAATVIISLMAFNNHQLIDKFVFWPYRMWRDGEWHRLITCGFIHADWGHLIFNMIALYSFGTFVEQAFGYMLPMGVTLYIVMYFLAIVTADAYNLYNRKDDYSYRSLGASGGVSAIIFASILLNPFSGIYLFFIPIAIPAVIFGPLYLVYCVVMAKRGQDNIGHVAHFTGSIIGFVFPLLFRPSLFLDFITQIQHKLQ